MIKFDKDEFLNPQIYSTTDEYKTRCRVTNEVINDVKELQQKIDKAIEYIKEFSWYYAKDDGTKGFVIEEEKEETFVNELLEILGDKE